MTDDKQQKKLIIISDLPDAIGLHFHRYDDNIGDVIDARAYHPYNQQEKHDGVFVQTSFNPPTHYNYFLCEMTKHYGKKPSYRDIAMAVSQLGTTKLVHKKHPTYKRIVDVRTRVGKIDTRRAIRLCPSKSEVFLYARGETSRVNLFVHAHTVGAPLGEYSEYFRITNAALLTVGMAEAILTWDELDNYPNAREMFTFDIELFDAQLNQMIQLCEQCAQPIST